MKKVKRYTLPIIALLLFILIMNSGEILKRSYTKNDDVQKYISIMKNNIIGEKWQKATATLNLLKNAWKIVGKRIQFSVERDEMTMIDTNISQIQGSLIIHDKSSAIIELQELLGHWNELEE